MKIRAALLCVLALTLLGSIATAAEPAPAASTPAAALPAAPAVAWPASITPVVPSGCGAATFSLPKVTNFTPAAGAASTQVCGSCSPLPCQGHFVNGSCGKGLTCFNYNNCSDNSIWCVCGSYNP